MNVVKSNLYSIDVNSDINRLYITLDGEWGQVYNLPEFSKDLEKAISHLKQGFTCCTNMVNMRDANADSQSMISSSKIVLLQNGITKEAFIIKNSEWLSINFNTGMMNMKGKAFEHMDDAENWLNAG